MLLAAFLLAAVVASASAQNPSDSDILLATGEIWTAAQPNFFTESELTYDVDGPVSGGNLFTFVNETRLGTGTYAAYRALLNNYVDTTGTEDTCDSTCVAERDDFLTQAMASPAMNKALEYIEAWEGETFDLRTYIDDLWFQGYSRSDGTWDSSGFEHVFLGEIDDGECKGYHNWVTTYEDEKANEFEYASYQDHCEPDMPKFSMEYKGYFKSINSLLMRSSPEYELAIYTLLFRYRRDQVSTIDCGGVNVGVQIWRQHCDFNPFNDCIGSAYFIC